MTAEAREAMVGALSMFVVIVALASGSLGWAWGSGVLRDFVMDVLAVLLPAGRGATVGKHAKRTTVRRTKRGYWRVELATFDAPSATVWVDRLRALDFAHGFEWAKAESRRARSGYCRVGQWIG